MAPDSLAPRLLLGRLCQANSRFKEAEQVWTEALARFPGNDGITLDLAYCLEQLGDITGAVRAAKEVLKREPDQATALNFLGYLYAEHNQNLTEAETMVSRALELEPDNGAYLDSMGWVYYRLGRLTEARARLERAVELTGDPVVHEHLGDVYKDLRLLELAREQYLKSLAGDGTNSRVKTKLAEIR
jgi:Flp pilus assembly protein TadD